MRTPPFLLGATLVFWGWQIGMPVVGAVLAVAVEAARWVPAKWELSDEDLRRIWNLCALIVLGSIVYGFSQNDGFNQVQGFFQHPTARDQRNISRASIAWLRWLPMLFAPILAAQLYSGRPGIPAETFSWWLRRRRKRARESGQPPPPSRAVDLTYPYFAAVLFASSFHGSDDTPFFWGMALLVVWGLWPARSPRFALGAWAVGMALAVGLGYLGQRGVSAAAKFVDNYNAAWLAEWFHPSFDPTQSRTSLGEVGRIQTSGNILVRLEVPQGSPPALLRSASYRIYRAPVWSSGTSTNTFETVSEESTNQTSYVLLPGKPALASVQIGCYLNRGKDVLPLPSGCCRLDQLPAYIVQKNPLGTVVAEGPKVVVFDAGYGPGATMDAPANTNEDLLVPPREIEALDQVLTNLPVRGKSPMQVMKAVLNLFQDHYTYSTWLGNVPLEGTNETALSRFLLREKRGHCEFFATASTLLLRRAGIPARYAVGYAVHEAGSGRKYVVRGRDAHAWCLAWDAEQRIWRDFDATPASWIATEETRASAFQIVKDAWSRLWFEFSKFRWGQGHLRQYLFWGLVPVVALLVYQILFRRKRGRRRGSKGAVEVPLWPGLDSEFYRLEQRLVALGMGRRPDEPLSEWLERVAADPAMDRWREPLRQLLRLHYRYRFDPQGITEAERTELQLQAERCLAGIVAAKE
jgi:transglutaminase-like putative cysteine protease